MADYRKKIVFLTVLLACSIPLSAAEIHNAANSGQINQLRAMLAENPAMANAKDNDGFTPLHKAAHQGYVDVADFLINNGAYIDAKTNNGFTPLHLAAFKNNEDMIGLLRKYEIIHAVKTANLTKVKSLLIKFMLAEKPDLVNAQDKDGKTPLLWAVINNHMNLIKLLFKYNADINTKDNNGWTALLLSATHG